MSNNRNTEIKVKCVICNTEHKIMVAFDDATEYLRPNRRHVQDIFPYLTAGERELLISQVCPKCWDEMFDYADEDYDEEYMPSPEDYKEWCDASCGLC